jgi:tRNA-2-methylthio-N6-dimethylallyladenosine synthase
LIEKRKKLFFIQTFGCQMNVNDSERLTGLLRSQGFEPAPDAASADFVFLNTCAVREKAASKLNHSLARLRHLKRRRPGLRIGVGGCVAQLDGPAILERSPHVDLLVGTHNLHRVPELLQRIDGGGGDGPAVDLDRKADPFAIPVSLVAHSSPVRAYVTAMEGCNHVCSFCVVPRTRGTEVHRPAAEIVSETASLVARGFPEVMLLGQTVNAYRDREVTFAGLLERVHAVEGLRRLRFTTSHPEHVDGSMTRAFRNLERLCPYLHLPFQSGSDRILTSMRRGYTREGYLATVQRLRDAVPDLALTTDVIVGYPGETEAEFEATLAVLERVDFDGVFAFTYSPRPGTTAARLADDVPEMEKRRRFQVLNDRQQQRQRRRNQALVGEEYEVLVESVDAPGRVSGRTPHFRIVHLDGPEDLVGRSVRVEITAAGPNALQGRLSQNVH